jgi:hypothetical protein
MARSWNQRSGRVVSIIDGKITRAKIVQIIRAAFQYFCSAEVRILLEESSQQPELSRTGCQYLSI